MRNNKITHNYNIHNIIKFRIIRENRFVLIPDINLRFSYFEVNEIDKPDLIINIGKFSPENDNTILIDNKYFIKKNYLYCKELEKGIKWELEIKGIEEPITTVNLNSKIFGLQHILYPDIFTQNLIGRSLIVYKLAQKGYWAVHAGAVSKDDKAFIFFGRGGANKSSIVMDLLREKDFKLVGDDWIIINKDKVYCFPTHFLEFNYKTTMLPDEHLHGLKDRLKLIFYLRKKHNYQNMDIKVAKITKIKSLFILMKSCENKLEIKNISNEIASKRFYLNNYLEETQTSMSLGKVLQGFIKYYLAYSFIYPDNLFVKYFNALKNRMKMLADTFTCFEITIPRDYSSNIRNKILKHIIE